MTVSIRFLGAAGTVTGAKYLVEGAGKKILVDCGLFQGPRQWRERNWHQPDFKPASIDAVLLTHAHVDHCAMLPRYQALGLNCPVYCSGATMALARLVLPDSARLQEEDARYRAKLGRSRHSPPLPLYTEEDAKRALKLFCEAPVGRSFPVSRNVSAEWKDNGHILGSCAIRLSIEGRVIVFSGDLGRYDIPIHRDPQPLRMGDLLLLESTYGDRLHAEAHPAERLAEVINRTAGRGGVVLIPSFAIGRAQLLLFYLRELKEQRRIADLPVIVDSPMATDATSIYEKYPEHFDAALLAQMKKGKKPFVVSRMHFIRDREESQKLNGIQEPMVIISASGMLTGGRVLHHLLHRVSNPANTVLFVGYQPPGSRGDWLKEGHPTVRIFGEEIPVGAEICEIDGLSAHADRNELLRWCRSCEGRPGKVAVVHGEPQSADRFAQSISAELGWDAFVAQYQQHLEI